MANPLELAISLMVVAASYLTEAVIRKGMTALVEAAPRRWSVDRLTAAFTNRCDQDPNWVHEFSHVVQTRRCQSRPDTSRGAVSNPVEREGKLRGETRSSIPLSGSSDFPLTGEKPGVKKVLATSGAPPASVEAGAGSQAVAGGSVAKTDEAGEERKSKC
jgi:hypothetical protein